MTTIITCKCAHAYQDQQYGRQQRVHNYGKKNSNWRCTVCGDTKSGPKTEITSKKS